VEHPCIFLTYILGNVTVSCLGNNQISGFQRMKFDVDDTIDFSNLVREGCRFRTVSISHLSEIAEEIKKWQDQKQFDQEFASQYLGRFSFFPPNELKTARSIIIVAMHRPPTRAVFHWEGVARSFILPPTYTAYDEKRIYVERLVAEAVAEDGYRVASSFLPLKLVAVRSGLVQYGRNNITYALGMGSFLRLTAVYSDMPCNSDDWQESMIMKRCDSCNLCRSACPTGAISTDRFLLHAEKCLTFHNEKEASIPFPAWIKLEWHNCIIGCMRCQAACPEIGRAHV
jgi:epoxyqueuosine reductase